MKRISCYLALGSLLLFSSPVLAIDLGARAIGMGGAYVALADDATAVYWNPAGLTKIKAVSLVPTASVGATNLQELQDFMDLMDSGDIPQDQNLNDLPSVDAEGAALAGLATKRLAISYLVQGSMHGEVVISEELPPSFAVDANSTVYKSKVLSVAFPISQWPGDVSIGANLRAVDGTAYEVNAVELQGQEVPWGKVDSGDGVALDLGVQARLGKTVQAGLVVRDAYSSFKWDSGSDTKPSPSYEAGVAVKPLIPGLTLAADVERTKVGGEDFTRFKAGLEQSLFGVVAIRVGGCTNPKPDLTTYTAGVGVGLFRFLRLEVAAASDLHDKGAVTASVITQF